jgi:hypothetical protein
LNIVPLGSVATLRGIFHRFSNDNDAARDGSQAPPSGKARKRLPHRKT